MNLQKNLSLSDIDIITTLSDSKKSTVSLAIVKDTKELVVLKDYHNTDMTDFYEHMKALPSCFFPQIYRIWKENDELYILEEYISGKTLQTILDDHTILSEADVTRYMTTLCQALHILHNSKPPIIHRDLKPENIMITSDGNLKLLDFDAAREYKSGQKHDTVLLGTKEYASPEQFGFMQTDIRSDIYSLGIVFSKLLECAQIRNSYAKKARRIIDRATMFDPDKRYPNTDDLLKDIRQLVHPSYRSYLPAVSILGSVLIVTLVILISGMKKQSSNVPDVFPDEQTASALPLTETTPVPTVTPGNTETTPVPTDDISADNAPSDSTPTESVYEYTSISREYRSKSSTIDETHPELYNGIILYDSDDDGVYKPDQETVIGRDFLALRYLKAYPRDIRISDVRMEGLPITRIYYTPYLEDVGLNGNTVYLSKEDYCQEYGNVVCISSDFLQTLEPGAYTLKIDMQNGGTGITFGYYLIVHGEEEKVDNFRIYMLTEIGYYSSKSRNDVIFQLNNTPYPIQTIRIGNHVLTPDEYDLMNDGFTVVFHADFLEQYTYLLGVDIIFTVENGKQAYARIINLENF